MVSREIWINMHSWVFQRPQIALVLRLVLFWDLWKTHSCMLYPNCTRNHAITYTNKTIIIWIYSLTMHLLYIGVTSENIWNYLYPLLMIDKYHHQRFSDVITCANIMHFWGAPIGSFNELGTRWNSLIKVILHSMIWNYGILFAQIWFHQIYIYKSANSKTTLF
jgi:hypothetical protein